MIERGMSMTENEAKNKLDSLHYAILNCSFNQVVSESEMEALCMAKDVLEEIQQYKSIGTVEEFNNLKEKSIPIKPIRQPNHDWTHEEVLCPRCRGYVSEYTNPYCRCGQNLDWK
jgi:hypothetical protein